MLSRLQAGPRPGDTESVTIEAVVFDFDGLLMDTEGTMVASWQYEWRQHGLELDLTTFLADHGGDLTRERYADLARAVGPGYDWQASHARRTAFRNDLNARLGLLPGIASWLDEAAASGLRLAVASSSPRDWVHRLLARSRHLDRFEVVGLRRRGQPAPSPTRRCTCWRCAAWACQPAARSRSRTRPMASLPPGQPACDAWRFPASHADPARFGHADLVLRSAADSDLAGVLHALAASVA